MANAIRTSLPSPLSRSPQAPARPARDGGSFELAAEILEHLAEAVIVVDRDGRARGMNSAARSLLDQEPGLRLGLWGPQGAPDSEPSGLHPIVREACQGAEPSGPLRIEREGRGTLRVRVVSLSPRGGQRAALFVSELADAPSVAEIMERFGTTPTESKVAQRMARGVRLEAIARDMGIAVHTVRGHLKQVFSKTGVHRQAELVALLLSLPSR